MDLVEIRLTPRQHGVFKPSGSGSVGEHPVWNRRRVRSIRTYPTTSPGLTRWYATPVRYPRAKRAEAVGSAPLSKRGPRCDPSPGRSLRVQV